MSTPPPPYTGVKLSGDLSVNRMANLIDWKREIAIAVAAFDFGTIASFLHEEVDVNFLNAELTLASLQQVVGAPMRYLQLQINEARAEYTNARAIDDPVGPALEGALEKITASFHTDYRKYKRRLSIYLLCTVDDAIAETLKGLMDFSRICESPFYLYVCMVIVAKPSAESRHFELEAMRASLAAIVPMQSETILAYVARYKRMCFRFLHASGRDHRDNIAERAQSFYMSLCHNPLWKPFLVDEYVRNPRWYVNWAAQQLLTNEAVLSAFIVPVVTRVVTGLQSVSLVNQHQAQLDQWAAPTVPLPPSPPSAPANTPAKSAGGAAKTALAAVHSGDTDRVRPDCSWCCITIGKGPHSHGTDTCFGFHAMAKAIAKKDAATMTQVVNILNSGKRPMFHRDGHVSDPTVPSTAATPSKTAASGKTEHPRKSAATKTALAANRSDGLSRYNYFSNLLGNDAEEDENDEDEDEDHFALVSIHYCDDVIDHRDLDNEYDCDTDVEIREDEDDDSDLPDLLPLPDDHSDLPDLIPLPVIHHALPAVIDSDDDEAIENMCKPLILDTGCSHHLFGDSSIVWNRRSIAPQEFSGVATLQVTEVGESAFGKTYLNCALRWNLVSYSQLIKQGAVVTIVGDSFHVSINGNPPLVFDRTFPGYAHLYCCDPEGQSFRGQQDEAASYALANVRRKKSKRPAAPRAPAVAKEKATPLVPPSVAPVLDVPSVPATDESLAAPTASVAPLATEKTVQSTVQSTPVPVHSHGKERAEEARRLHRAFGHPSDLTLGQLLDAQAFNTHLTGADLRLAKSLLHECVACAKGKETQHTGGAIFHIASVVGQVLHIDLIYGRSGRDPITRKATMSTWLLAVDELTGYTVLIDIVSKVQPILLEAIRKVMSYLQKYGHVVQKIVTDGESCFGACATDLGNMGVALVQRPPGEHEKFAESKTRMLRAKMRAIEADLGYDIPDTLSSYLAIAAIFFSNLVPNTRTPFSSPHTLVTGERVDVAIYGKFIFGQPVLIPTKDAPTPTNRDEHKATEGIFLGHLFGATGSAYFLLLPASSKADVQVRAVASARAMGVVTDTYRQGLANLRAFGTVIPMSVEDELNRVVTSADFAAMVKESRALTSKGKARAKPLQGGGVLSFAKQIVQPEPAVMSVPEKLVKEPVPVPLAAPLPVPVSVPVPVPVAVLEPATTSVAALPAAPVVVPVATPSGPPLRVGARYSTSIYRANVADLSVVDVSHTALLATLSEELDQYGPAGEAALMLEAKQMVDLNVFDGTDLARQLGNMPSHKRREILNCRAFLERKRDGRIKARIIGGTGASRQDRSHYPDISSPTVRYETVTILLKVAAVKGNKLAVLDVPGAYLHAPMQDMRLGSEPDTPRFVKVSGLLARVLVKLTPSWSKLLSDEGVLVLKLNRALYGLVESARLWNEEIAGTLTAAGFSQSTQDPCLFVHAEKGISLVIYVDDFLLSYSKEKDLRWLELLLQGKYGKPRVQSGDSVDYLNLRIRKLSTDFAGFGAGSFIVDQTEYCRAMLDKYGIVGTEDMPHVEDFFSTSASSLPLSQSDTSRYVSMAMSLLFTCNRVRSDVFLHTSFLCTRLKCPTSEDLDKLERVMRYIAGTINHGIVYSAGSADLRVFAWIDASYATHDDAKGHSGTIISVGSVPGSNGNIVYIKSRKQKLVARSSTEAELIALHDGLPQVVWTRNVLEELGYEQPPADVFQDNKSTIFMVEAGHGNHHRSKHIAVRFFYAKGLLDQGVIHVKHLSTDLMLADTFTKALSRKQFIAMRDQMMVDLSVFNA